MKTAGSFGVFFELARLTVFLFFFQSTGTCGSFFFSNFVMLLKWQ
jgi:hypothetical protein